MFTSPVVGTQAPLEIVQVNVAVVPGTNPVNPVVGSVSVVIVATPAVTVHCPVPTKGTLPASVVVVKLQKFWSPPAAAALGGGATEITTSLVEGTQAPLVIVQRNVAEAPITNPVTPEVGEVGVVIVTAPETNVQIPEPIAGAFPAKVVVVTLHKLCADPAFEGVTGAPLSTTIVSSEAGQTPFEIVQVKVSVAGEVSPVIFEVGSAGVVTVPVPKSETQAPVPTVGVLAASEVEAAAQRDWSLPAFAVVGN